VLIIVHALAVFLDLFSILITMYLEDQYMSSLRPMPIAPLFLCGAHVSNSTLLTVLEFLFKPNSPRYQKKGK
jgi:hypothetical protein